MPSAKILVPLALLFAAVPLPDVAAKPAGSAGAARQTRVSPYDGVYGPLTVARVKRFQLAHGLVGDGVAGPATLRALRLPATTTLKPGMTGPAVAQLQAALARRGFWNLPPAVAEATFPPVAPFDIPEPIDDTWMTPVPLYTDQPAAPATPEPYAEWDASPSPSPSTPVAPEGLRANVPDPVTTRYLRFGGGMWFHGGNLTPHVRAELGQGRWLGRLGVTFLPGIAALPTTPGTGPVLLSPWITTVDLHAGYQLGDGTLLVGVRVNDLLAFNGPYGSLGFRVGGPIWNQAVGWGVMGLGGLGAGTQYFFDGLAALEGRAGPFGLTAGWRVLGMHQLNSPIGMAPMTFSGPQLGLTLQF